MTKLALCGNPNSGKSSLFNKITGQKQKVANYPGVTVDIKYGKVNLESQSIQLIDLPGTYSFYPSSSDELVVSKILANPNDSNYPNGIVYVIDSTQLDKQLLLLTQILALRIPCILALNMSDLINEGSIKLDENKLAKKLDLHVVKISSKSGIGISQLKSKMELMCEQPHEFISNSNFYTPSTELKEAAGFVKEKTGFENTYQNILVAHHYRSYPFIEAADKVHIEQELASKKIVFNLL